MRIFRTPVNPVWVPRPFDPLCSREGSSPISSLSLHRAFFFRSFFSRRRSTTEAGVSSYSVTPSDDDSARPLSLASLRRHQEHLTRGQDTAAAENRRRAYDGGSPSYEAKRKALRYKQRHEYALHRENGLGISSRWSASSNRSRTAVDAWHETAPSSGESGRAVGIQQAKDIISASVQYHNAQVSIDRNEKKTEDEGNGIFAVFRNEPPKNVYVVDSVAAARVALEQLMSLRDREFACDTEVMDIDVAKQSPACHGKVICFSVYAGVDVHFGEHPPTSGVKRSMLWVDTYLNGDENRQEEAREIFETFRPFLESDDHRKIWHNYSFDRHVLERMGISSRGFAGDTMHMARLWDSSRTTRGGYSLEVLTGIVVTMSRMVY